MPELLVAAFDPGAITGFGFWGPDGHFWSGQEEPEAAMRLVIPFMREHPCGLVVIEDCFVGPGARASLEVAKSAGEVRGWLNCAGVMPGKPWEPAAATWRKHVGITGWEHLPNGKKRAAKRKDFEARARNLAGHFTGKIFPDNQTHHAEAICMSQAGWERWISRKAA